MDSDYNIHAIKKMLIIMLVLFTVAILAQVRNLLSSNLRSRFLCPFHMGNCKSVLKSRTIKKTLWKTVASKESIREMLYALAKEVAKQSLLDRHDWFREALALTLTLLQNCPGDQYGKLTCNIAPCGAQVLIDIYEKCLPRLSGELHVAVTRHQSELKAELERINARKAKRLEQRNEMVRREEQRKEEARVQKLVDAQKQEMNEQRLANLA